VEAAAFLLGALGHEERRYRSHLAQGPVCQAEVAELRLVIDAVPSAIPTAVASVELRERVMAVVRSEAELLKAPGQAPIWCRVAGAGGRSRAGPLLAAGALAAALIAAFISGSAGPAVRAIPARIAFASPDARAELREVSNRGELVLSGNAPPAAGKIYEVWLRQAGHAPAPTDVQFTVSSGGSGTVGVPGSLGDVREVLVSAEPFGGSRQLTGPVLIRVRLPS